MIELKPCPFCGGKAEIILLLSNYGVGCTACPGAVFPCPKMTKEEAVKAWNTREKMEVEHDCNLHTE